MSKYMARQALALCDSSAEGMDDIPNRANMGAQLHRAHPAVEGRGSIGGHQAGTINRSHMAVSDDIVPQCHLLRDTAASRLRTSVLLSYHTEIPLYRAKKNEKSKHVRCVCVCVFV